LPQNADDPYFIPENARTGQDKDDIDQGGDDDNQLRGAPEQVDRDEQRKERKRKKRSRRDREGAEADTLPATLDIVPDEDQQLGRHTEKSGSGERKERKRRRRQRDADEGALDDDNAKVVGDKGGDFAPNDNEFAQPGIDANDNGKATENPDFLDENQIDNNNGGDDNRGSQEGKEPDFGEAAFF
jgi:hypothetical protein